MKNNLLNNDKVVVNIGEQQYYIKSLELLEAKIVEDSCVLRTSTPVSIRIPEKAYSLYKIKNFCFNLN
jgi:CRISPR/Cas system endoribonuclease Cas6 (RAMP superfamily)